MDNSSVIGRLLEELSWVGATIRDYRNGGRGYENVLTAEALQGLSFLPRKLFFGSVIARAHGADGARQQLVTEIENARFSLLPGNHYLIPSGETHQKKLPVQPDGLIESSSVYGILEVKRIRSSSFQSEQLAREYVLVLREARQRTPLMLLVLGQKPPVNVAKHGKLSVEEAISVHLKSVLSRSEGFLESPERALARIAEVVCWITWHEISAIVDSQLAKFQCADSSVRASIDRLATSVTDAIAWHG